LCKDPSTDLAINLFFKINVLNLSFSEPTGAKAVANKAEGL
jgi:hypothetical protein